ncbi:MAG: hypothetical protein OSJ34_02515 [Muribaculaceae bacterium]|jgi:Uncharacterized protein conserved in bacteria|nr:hypothetical protein [Muribaculaceae bacterium]
MSKKDQTEQQGANAIDEINDQLTGISRKVQENQRIIYISTGIVAFIVICVLVYIYAFRNPGIERGNNEIGLADLQLFQGNDSIALTQYESIANEHGYSAGNRAALQAAILLFEKGEYQQALDYLSKYSADEAFIGAAAYSLEGDCYVNLDQLDNAVKSFNKAIAQSNDNPSYTPFFMLKLARVYNAQQKYGDELKVYEKIEKEYPAYGNMYGVDIRKYLERARLQAAQ